MYLIGKYMYSNSGILGLLFIGRAFVSTCVVAY